MAFKAGVLFLLIGYTALAGAARHLQQSAATTALPGLASLANGLSGLSSGSGGLPQLGGFSLPQIPGLPPFPFHHPDFLHVGQHGGSGSGCLTSGSADPMGAVVKLLAGFATGGPAQAFAACGGGSASNNGNNNNGSGGDSIAGTSSVQYSGGGGGPISGYGGGGSGGGNPMLSPIYGANAVNGPVSASNSQGGSSSGSSQSSGSSGQNGGGTAYAGPDGGTPPQYRDATGPVGNGGTPSPPGEPTLQQVVPFNLGLFAGANSTDDVLALQLALSLLANLNAGNTDQVVHQLAGALNSGNVPDPPIPTGAQAFSLAEVFTAAATRASKLNETDLAWQVSKAFAAGAGAALQPCGAAAHCCSFVAETLQFANSMSGLLGLNDMFVQPMNQTANVASCLAYSPSNPASYYSSNLSLDGQAAKAG